MNYLIIDDYETRKNYAKDLADKCNGTVEGSTIHFNDATRDKEIRTSNHHKAMDLITTGGIYGFSNLWDGSSCFKSIQVTNLKLTEDGWYQLASETSKIGALVVTFCYGNHNMNVFRYMDKAIRKVIKEIDEANIEIAEAMGVQVNE